MDGKRITLIGVGNIGSHNAAHLARMPGVTGVTLVDPDRYTPENLATQSIYPRDSSRPKAIVMAARLRRINPQLKAVPIVAAVEDVPLGRLRADVILAALDRRRARQNVNEIAWRLGVPWCDAGVMGQEMLARVNVYLPGMDTPCLECAWDRQDYDAIEQEYICGAGPQDTPSNSTSALGALAGALLAIECGKLLAGDIGHSAAGRQVTFDARHHKLLATSFRRNPSCLFDHQTWHIEPLPCRPWRTTLAEAMEWGSGVAVAGHRFVRALACPACGVREDGLRLERPVPHCPECGRRMAPPGFDALDRLDGRCPEEFRACTLAQVGIRAGDVIDVGGRRIEIMAGER